jgi:hypothetical protein
MPRKFVVGDRVKNIGATYNGEVRTVRQENSSDIDTQYLTVRKHEDDDKSPLWTWTNTFCVLISPAPVFNVHDRVTLGTGSEVREILGTRIHSKTNEMQYRVDLPEEKKEKWVTAIALHLVQRSSPKVHNCVNCGAQITKHESAVCDDCFDKFGAAAYVGSAALHPVVTSSDPAQVEPVAYDLSSTESPADARKLIDDAASLVGAQRVVPELPADFNDYIVNSRINELETLVSEWQQKAVDARAEASHLEKELTKLQNMVVRREPIPTQPVAAPSTCVEYKTVEQSLADGSLAADREAAEIENAGWTPVNISVVSCYFKDGGEGASYIRRVLTFKRTVTSAPQPAPTTSTGAHGTLTADFVRHNRSPFSAPTKIIESVHPVGTLIVEDRAPIKLGPIGTSIKQIGVEATREMMTDFAVQKAFDRAAERVNAMPVFSKSLHQLKAGE